MKAILKTIPTAILIAFGGIHLSSNAAIVSKVCEVNEINACENKGATIPASSILILRGFSFDTVSGLRPEDATGGYVIIRNEDTLKDYKLPIQAIEARPDVVADSITGTLKPENYDVVKAGFAAQVFMSSLPTGYYTVQEARVNMKGQGVVRLDITDAEQRAAFRIASDSSLFRVVKEDGTIIPISTGKPSNGTIPVTGYPAMRDGSYTIEATLPTLAGAKKKSVGFKYERPEVSVPVSMPLVEGFPGLDAKMSLTNPLSKRPLDFVTLPVVVEETASKDLTIDGKKVEANSELALSRMGMSVGVYQFKVKDQSDLEAIENTKLWVNLPDAPNIKLVANKWNPDSKIKIEKTADTIPVKVEDIDVKANLKDPSAETCQILRTLKTDNIMGQFVGTDCAIKFSDFPDMMKYSPYYPNALRGAVDKIGDNEIKYQVGIVYTDPETKKTSFYPAKSGVSKVTIQGVEPEKIELEFDSDKTLKPFYDENQGMFPGKHFGFADPVQPRALGRVQVSAPHKGVHTLIKYPDGETKEAATTLLKSMVPMAMKFAQPWETKKVIVESWYEKAPEYKTTKEMDIVSIPLGPVVLIDKNIQSHDKADTVITGAVGIPKGQQTIFEKSSMGQWQVSILDEKTGVAMSEPVDVKDDGTYEVNLGTLDAGSRYIIAQAKMVTTDGAVSNSAVLSKKFSLFTARGEKIEAYLASRNSSGPAPFVQTIVTNYKDPKMQSSVKFVTWEYLDADGAWKQVMNGNDPKIGINLMARVEEAGEVQYRAVLTNKYSGLSYTTEPLKLIAFNKPTFSIEGPTVVQAKRPITLKIEANNGFEAEYQWRLVTKGGVEGELTGTGESFTFTPTEVKSYAIEVIGREKGAPADNPAANVKKTASVRAVNPLTARASIQGPRTVEAGKTYEYKAIINDVVSNPVGKDYELKGYWVLPDGSRVDGTELAYTPKPDDKLLSFYTYVDGYPDETSVATYSISTWAYEWPDTWQIRLVPSYLDVPAILKFYVETPNFKRSALRGEDLTFTWSLPDGVTKNDINDTSGTLTISKAGKYQVAVQVSDGRGNVTNVTSDEFMILPAATVETEIALVSKYGENVYAPGSYYISTKTSKLPRGDSFLRHEAVINGVKVGEYTGTGHYVNFAEAGNYDVTIRTLTKSGNYGEQNIAVEAKPAPEPICTVAVKQSTSGILLTPDCTVEAGYVRGYTWTYVLDGETKTATSKSFLVAKQWLANNSIGAVTLDVETDMGAKTSVVVDYSNPN